MTPGDTPRLRNALRKLHAAPIDWTDPYAAATAGQEALDVVALLAGLKPVYVLGRGFADPGWRDHVLGLAAAWRLHVREGPYWVAAPPPADLPGWFAEIADARLRAGRAHYLARTRAAAAAVAAACASGRPSIAEEARLLGFPECCVADHYAGAAAYLRASFAILRLRTGGDEAEMRRLAAGDAPLALETEDERALLAAAATVRPARHTSLNMCAGCAATEASPARLLAARYAALARRLAGSPGRHATG